MVFANEWLRSRACIKIRAYTSVSLFNSVEPTSPRRVKQQRPTSVTSVRRKTSKAVGPIGLDHRNFSNSRLSRRLYAGYRSLHLCGQATCLDIVWQKCSLTGIQPTHATVEVHYTFSESKHLIKALYTLTENRFLDKNKNATR